MISVFQLMSFTMQKTSIRLNPILVIGNHYVNLKLKMLT